MTKCNVEERGVLHQTIVNANHIEGPHKDLNLITRTCPSCGHQIKCQDQVFLYLLFTDEFHDQFLWYTQSIYLSIYLYIYIYIFI